MDPDRDRFAPVAEWADQIERPQWALVVEVLGHQLADGPPQIVARGTPGLFPRRTWSLISNAVASTQRGSGPEVSIRCVARGWLESRSDTTVRRASTSSGEMAGSRTTSLSVWPVITADSSPRMCASSADSRSGSSRLTSASLFGSAPFRTRNAGLAAQHGRGVLRTNLTSSAAQHGRGVLRTNLTSSAAQHGRGVLRTNLTSSRPGPGLHSGAVIGASGACVTVVRPVSRYSVTAWSTTALPPWIPAP